MGCLTHQRVTRKAGKPFQLYGLVWVSIASFERCRHVCFTPNYGPITRRSEPTLRAMKRLMHRSKLGASAFFDVKAEAESRLTHTCWWRGVVGFMFSLPPRTSPPPPQSNQLAARPMRG
jgi:hypothetical protein